MAQYLMNLLNQNEFPAGFGVGNPDTGRMGDYVFNQEGITITSSTYSSS
jgi:hypothetical protein